MKAGFIISALFVLKAAYAQTGTVDYFGLTPPGDSAVIFAPGILSLTDRLEGEIAFSPDGKEIYFTVFQTGGNDPKIYYTRYENNIWTEQSEAPFSVNEIVSSPSFSADGNRLFFFKDDDIWVVERTDEGWSDPQLLPPPFNSSSTDRYYMETDDGLGFIASDRSGGTGGGDIYSICQLSDSSYIAENLGPEVNSAYWDFLPCIAHDGSYLIFKSMRSDFKQHLFISFKTANDGWTVPVNLEKSGAGINIANQNELTPSLSPDGKYLFFGRHNDSGDIFDIYWVSTNFISGLKEDVLSSSVNQTEKIKIYPNPARNTIYIEYPGLSNREVSFQIYDITGKMIKKGLLTGTNIDISRLNNGLYIFRIDIDEEIFIKKILTD